MYKNSRRLSENRGKELRVLSPKETIKFLGSFYDVPKTTLSIEVVKICNLLCPGCWVDLGSIKSDTLIDMRLLETIMKFGRNVGIDKVCFVGGEPTLHPQLSDIVKHAISLGYAGTSITTNGVFPPAKMQELAKSGLNNISFSIDGSSSEVHDKIRPSLSGKSTFNLTLNNFNKAISYSKEYGFEVRVNHTLFPSNFYDAESMIKLVAGIGVKRIRIHFSFPGDQNRRSNSKCGDQHDYIHPNSWVPLCIKCKELSKQLGIEILISTVYGTQEVHKAQTMKPPYLHVQSNGNLLMCNTHARLVNSRQQFFGTIIDESRIMANMDCILFDESQKGNCCKAIPKLILMLPKWFQNQIKDAGGMGCIYLPGLLVDSKHWN